MKYIDAEKLIAEIERLYDGEVPSHGQQCEFEDGYFTGIATISKFIDSLQQEQPEADLEKEIGACWQNWLSPSNQKEVEGILPKTEFAMYAHHFYELGLNARKEE